MLEIEIQALREQIAKLEARIAALEAALKSGYLPLGKIDLTDESTARFG